MRRILIVAVLGLAACGGGGKAKDDLAVSGTFTLKGIDNTEGGATDCHGTGGYSDFRPGMNLTVKDGAGQVVGVGAAQSFTEADLRDSDTVTTDPMELAGVDAKLLAASQCWLKFTVPVKRSDFYQVEAGHRGGITYSFDDLEGQDWFVQLTLGD